MIQLILNLESQNISNNIKNSEPPPRSVFLAYYCLELRMEFRAACTGLLGEIKARMQMKYIVLP